MKKIQFIILLTLFSGQIFAQNGLLKIVSKVPGNFALDIGFSTLENLPDARLQAFDSRSFNGYLMLDLGLERSGFSINPGIGIASENYSFEEQFVIISEVNEQKQVLFQDDLTLQKSKLNATYLDIPLEIRWASNVGRKAFRITTGIKGGILINSHTKIKDKDDTKFKTKKDFHLTPWRANIYGRVGYNWYAFFVSYGLTDFFEANNVTGTPLMFGISLVGYR